MSCGKLLSQLYVASSECWGGGLWLAILQESFLIRNFEINNFVLCLFACSFVESEELTEPVLVWKTLGCLPEQFSLVQ